VDGALALPGGEGEGEPGAARHRSLAAVADWSYQLLSEPEQRVFRRLAVLPGPFTLDTAEAVAGPDAGELALRLVDCSLLAPPLAGLDGRMRYSMLLTLRDYGLGRLAEAGEEQHAMAALAAYALTVTSRAAAWLETSDSELPALQWLDAESAALSAALDWALEHDPATALLVATALAPWWLQRGRMAEGYKQLAAAAGQAALATQARSGEVSPGGQADARAQFWLGLLAGYSGDHASARVHHSTAYEAAAALRPLSDETILALSGRAIASASIGNVAAGADDARRALALARESGSRTALAYALTNRCIIAHFSGDDREALALTREAQQSLTADVPGFIARGCRAIMTVVLADAGDLDAARAISDSGLAQCREAGYLPDLATVLLGAAHVAGLAGNVAEMAGLLHEVVEVASRIGDRNNLRHCLLVSGFLCAATERWAEAVTLWAAYAAETTRAGIPGPSAEDRRRLEWMQRIEGVLQPALVRQAEQRGTQMTLAAAAEFVSMLTASSEAEPPGAAADLTARERQLVTLVAQGRTNAEIAAELFISVRTVSSHLDRIRDKTGCRRRAELTRLALRDGLA
jgi:DNA-binding CsgD family transcriptional regulator